MGKLIFNFKKKAKLEFNITVSCSRKIVYERKAFRNVIELAGAAAKTLNVLFHRSLMQIGNTDFIPHIQTFSDIAFRAQNQCRKPLAVLAD